MRVLVKVTLACAVFLPHATARDPHLVPPPSYFDRQGGEWKGYMEAVRKAFAETPLRFRVRCIVMPSFLPEWMVAVLQDSPTETPRVLLVEASYPFPALLQSAGVPDPSRFDPGPYLTRRPERTISADVADEIAKAWSSALKGVRIPEATTASLVDGTEYLFTGRTPLVSPDGRSNSWAPFFSGSTRSPHEGTMAGQMVALAGLLRRYVAEEEERQPLIEDILRVCAAIQQVPVPAENSAR